MPNVLDNFVMQLVVEFFVQITRHQSFKVVDVLCIRNKSFVHFHSFFDSIFLNEHRSLRWLVVTELNLVVELIQSQQLCLDLFLRHILIEHVTVWFQQLKFNGCTFTFGLNRFLLYVRILPFVGVVFIFKMMLKLFQLLI